MVYTEFCLNCTQNCIHSCMNCAQKRIHSCIYSTFHSTRNGVGSSVNKDNISLKGRHRKEVRSSQRRRNNFPPLAFCKGSLFGGPEPKTESVTVVTPFSSVPTCFLCPPKQTLQKLSRPVQPPDTTPWQEENRSLTLASQRHLHDDRYEEVWRNC